MAIIVCRECRQETRNNRDTCMHCGAPLTSGELIEVDKKPFNLFLLIVVSIAVALVVGAYVTIKPYFVAPKNYNIVEITSQAQFYAAIRQRKASIVVFCDINSDECYDYLPVIKEIGRSNNLSVYRIDTDSVFFPDEDGQVNFLFGRNITYIPTTIIYKRDQILGTHEGFQGREYIEQFLINHNIIKKGGLY